MGSLGLFSPHRRLRQACSYGYRGWSAWNHPAQHSTSQAAGHAISTGRPSHTTRLAEPAAAVKQHPRFFAAYDPDRGGGPDFGKPARMALHCAASLTSCARQHHLGLSCRHEMTRSRRQRRQPFPQESGKRHHSPMPAPRLSSSPLRGIGVAALVTASAVKPVAPATMRRSSPSMMQTESRHDTSPDRTG
jgi:hypothetical protein